MADEIETDGDKAIAETVDLYRQLAEMHQTQADALTRFSPFSKKPNQVLIRDDLTSDDYESVLAHEVGHVIDQYVGEIDVPTSVHGELGDLFNTLNNPRRDSTDLK